MRIACEIGGVEIEVVIQGGRDRWADGGTITYVDPPVLPVPYPVDLLVARDDLSREPILRVLAAAVEDARRCRCCGDDEVTRCGCEWTTLDEPTGVVAPDGVAERWSVRYCETHGGAE